MKTIKYFAILFIIFSISGLSYLLLESINALQHLDLMKEFVDKPIILDESNYDLSNIKFKRVYLNGKYSLKDKCEDGCNLRVSRNKRNVYYVIDKKEDGYYYKLIVNSSLIAEDKFLGKTIEEAYFIPYMDNIVLYNIIGNEELAYDYIIIINKNYALEELKSLGAKSLELTNQGIIYYDFKCSTTEEETDELIKYSKMAFSSETNIISVEPSSLSWCA